MYTKVETSHSSILVIFQVMEDIIHFKGENLAIICGSIKAKTKKTSLNVSWTQLGGVLHLPLCFCRR